MDEVLSCIISRCRQDSRSDDIRVLVSEQQSEDGRGLQLRMASIESSRYKSEEGR